MKYIRTKDEIREVLNTYYREEEVAFYVIEKTKYESMLVRTPDQVIKQADTIEELCDEFVYNNKIIEVEYDLENHLWIGDKLFEDIKGAVYGAIWTDKGLIYVAKMNDKGELELL